MVFFHFKILVSKFERWKGWHFCGRPREAHSLVTPLQTMKQLADTRLCYSQLPELFSNWRIAVTTLKTPTLNI